MLNSLIEAFSGEGLFFMYAITLVGAYSIAIGLDRIAHFWFLWVCNWDDLHASIREQKWEEADQKHKNIPFRPS